MTATDRLDQIEARANAATEGPWEVDRRVDTFATFVAGPTGLDVCGHFRDDDECESADAEFIAHARTDVPALVAALRAVLQEAAKGPAEGWYEWIAPRTATTHVAYVHENGNVYLPDGEFSSEDFLLAGAEGKAHRLIRAADVRAAVGEHLGGEPQ